MISPHLACQVAFPPINMWGEKNKVILSVAVFFPHASSCLSKSARSDDPIFSFSNCGCLAGVCSHLLSTSNSASVYVYIMWLLESNARRCSLSLSISLSPVLRCSFLFLLLIWRGEGVRENLKYTYSTVGVSKVDETNIFPHTHFHKATDQLE